MTPQQIHSSKTRSHLVPLFNWIVKHTKPTLFAFGIGQLSPMWTQTEWGGFVQHLKLQWEHMPDTPTSTRLCQETMFVSSWWPSVGFTSAVSEDKCHALARSEWVDGSSVWWLNQTTLLSPTEQRLWKVFTKTAVGTPASTGKVSVVTPFVTSCSIRPFVEILHCTWACFSG